MSDLPALSEDFEINEVSDGLVAYDSRRDRVHYLNPTAAIVLDLCTGQNSEAEIVRLVQATYELAEPPVAEVRNCLMQLRDEGVIS